MQRILNPDARKLANAILKPHNSKGGHVWVMFDYDGSETHHYRCSRCEAHGINHGK